MNHLMARLIFCFFAEATEILVGKGRFTETVAQMSAMDSSNTHVVIATLFRAMNTKREDRAAARISHWAEYFPYVNGALFSGGDEVLRFSRIARSYLLHVGGLDWTRINPDAFGSMIQLVWLLRRVSLLINKQPRQMIVVLWIPVVSRSMEGIFS